ncbi:hypothetical protein ACFXPA_16125 [Amycolatopsis sp. NPDC059090]|uniref:hypothetical protein n=1 Tax=unclassified Amycolatopsis TaxID=2618356 RepID=UPI00366D3392
MNREIPAPEREGVLAAAAARRFVESTPADRAERHAAAAHPAPRNLFDEEIH